MGKKFVIHRSRRTGTIIAYGNDTTARLIRDWVLVQPKIHRILDEITLGKIQGGAAGATELNCKILNEERRILGADFAKSIRVVQNDSGRTQHKK
jgi:hypothetical protein